MEIHKLQKRLLKAMLYKEKQNRNGVRDTIITGALTLGGIGADIHAYTQNSFTTYSAIGMTLATLGGAYSTLRGTQRWRNARHNYSDRLRYQEEIGVTSEHVKALARGELSLNPDHPNAPKLKR